VDLNTAELVARARNGDTEAFCELVETCQANIRAYIARFVNYDHEDVLDLAQDTFLIAYDRLHSFDPEQPFYPWVRGIARNVAMMFLRKSGRRKRHEKASMDDLLTQWSEERLEQNYGGELDYINELRECLKKLKESASEMVRLRYFEQLSIGEVARRINRPEGTVRTLIMRVRRALRKCIESELALERAAE
jgi:RNA polymerase sigma-70 factor (ECF subfamily)